MEASKIKVVIILIFTVFFAVYLGIAAATAQMEAVAWVAAAFAVVMLFGLGKNIWILIPIALGLSGGINALPGSPPPWWLAMMATAGMLTLRHIMRTNELRYRFTWMDFAIFLQAVAVGQAWLRNPAGLNVFGGDTVGGKNNIVFSFAILSFILLGSVKIDMRLFKKAIVLMLGFAIADGLIMASSGPFPAISRILMPIYSGVSFTNDPNATGMADIELSSVRVITTKELGLTLGTALLTMYRPLTLCNPMYLIRFTLFGIAVYLVMLSGFRSVLGMFAILFVVGSWIRGYKKDIIVAALMAPLALSLLAITGMTKKLPYGAQRILSVLPVDVEDRARLDGTTSTDWRVDMWVRALTSDRYIKNKILGDGFGYDAAVQKQTENAMAGDSRAMTSQAHLDDVLMLRGSFHGFHVETIRFTGVVGLIFALIGMGIFLRCALTQIRYFRNRPEWPYVLYIAIPFLIHPFYYMLVFGSYRSGFTLILIYAGLLKMLDNIRLDEISQQYKVTGASGT